MAAVSDARASVVDGMTLSGAIGSSPGSIALTWTGGEPNYSVFRSTNPASVVQAANQIAQTSLRAFEDPTVPAPGVAFFYELSSACVYNPPEVCDGVDNDCDGTVDGPAADTACQDSCGYINPTCVQGSCVPPLPTMNSCGSSFETWQDSLPALSVVQSFTTDEQVNPSAPGIYLASETETSPPTGVLTAYSMSTGQFRWTTGVGVPAGIAFGGTSIGGLLTLTDQAGTIYGVRPTDGQISWEYDTVVRIGRCTTGSITGAPVFQENARSNAQFQQAMTNSLHGGQSLVFAATRSECGGTSANRIVALYAETGLPRWIFNSDKAHMMDSVVDSCTLDYSRNLLFCASELESGAYQNTLWAISTLDGSVQWSRNAGSILGRPLLIDGFSPLYIATLAGAVMAFDPVSGNPTWTEPVQLPNEVALGLTGDQSQCLGAKTRLFAYDVTGTLYAILDEGTTGKQAWSRPGWSGRPVELDRAPFFYGVTMNGAGGTAHQFDPATGADLATAPVSFSTLSQARSVTMPNFNPALVMAGTNAIGLFCAPMILGGPPLGASCTRDADCTLTGILPPSPCYVGQCDLTSHTCHVDEMRDGLACDDGKSCTSSSACEDGACLSGDDSACTCTAVGDAACPAGSTCCGTGLCTDLTTDPANCGTCGVACVSGQRCSGGVCIQDSSVCGSGLTSAKFLNPAATAGQLAGADAITYNQASHRCNAFLTTFSTTTTGALKIVTPTAVSTITTTGVTPMSGVAVTPSGNPAFGTVVNDSSGTPVPGMRFINTTAGTLPLVATGTATTGTEPFTNTSYDMGPVGPAFDTVQFATQGFDVMYFGNWNAPGDLEMVATACGGCSWSETPVSGWTTLSGRITALAYENRLELNDSPHGRTPELIVGQGSVVRIFRLQTRSLQALDLNDSTIYGGVVAILSLAVHPSNGDIYAEVRDSSRQIQLLVIHATDLSVRNISNVNLDLHLAATPFFLTGEGRLSASSGVLLERILMPATTGGTPSFQDIALSP